MLLGIPARRAVLLVAPLVGLVVRAGLGCGGEPFTAGPSDAGPPDTSTADVTPPSDDAAEAPADGPAGAFCLLHPNVTFCEDFEGVSTIADLTTRWSSPPPIGNGTLTLGPGLLSAHALVASAGNNDQAALAHAPFPGKPSMSVRVEYDLRVDAEKVAYFDNAALTTIVLGTNPSTDPAVYLYVGNGGNPGSLFLAWNDAADAGRGFHYQALNYAPMLGTWDGRWGFTIAMSDGTITVTHQGVGVATSNQKLAMGDLQASAVTLIAGLPHDSGNTGTVTVAIDNLIVDAR